MRRQILPSPPGFLLIKPFAENTLARPFDAMSDRMCCNYTRLALPCDGVLSV
jgi:hypothetical protein